MLQDKTSWYYFWQSQDGQYDLEVHSKVHLVCTSYVQFIERNFWATGRKTGFAFFFSFFFFFMRRNLQESVHFHLNVISFSIQYENFHNYWNISVHGPTITLCYPSLGTSSHRYVPQNPIIVIKTWSTSPRIIFSKQPYHFPKS